MDLKELIHQANQLVHEEGHTLQDLLEKNDFPSEVDAIIQMIKDYEALIDTPTAEDYSGLKNALIKRREISLKATYAAISHILLPEKFPLKSLDNFKSNLQSEKKPPKEKFMPESEELSQEDIEALLAGNLTNSKDKKAAKNEEGQLSNDEIDDLLAGVGPLKSEKKAIPSEMDFGDLSSEVENQKKINSPTKNSLEKEEFTNEEIESLLAGESANNSVKIENPDLSLDELNSLLSAATLGEESDQISEDDIKSLLAAQDEQDKVNPLAKALNMEEEKPSLSRRRESNTEKIQPNITEAKPKQLKEEFVSGQTKIPENILPIKKSFEDLFAENDAEFNKPSVKEEFLLNIERNSSNQDNSFNDSYNKPTSIERADEQMQAGDVKERVLNDVYALYVNKDGKPVLHAECPTRDEIKKAYLQAMQNYPQNSLFIEKISRKEIIVIKETKEIINLKINISFD